MVQETIFQHWIFTKFAFPFLLIWTLIFALLGKTKLLGENKQIDSIVAFVIAFIFVGLAYPKEIVGNLILFLTLAIIIVFIGLLLWGFVSGASLKENIIGDKVAKWIVGIVIVVAVGIAVFWASGLGGEILDLLFKQSWSSTFWTNVAFIVVVAGALALVLKGSNK